eukprot:768204-Hanusia_phi.AAC.7
MSFNRNYFCMRKVDGGRERGRHGREQEGEGKTSMEGGKRNETGDRRAAARDGVGRGTHRSRVRADHRLLPHPFPAALSPTSTSACRSVSGLSDELGRRSKMGWRQGELMRKGRGEERGG